MAPDQASDFHVQGITLEAMELVISKELNKIPMIELIALGHSDCENSGVAYRKLIRAFTVVRSNSGVELLIK